MTLKDSIRYRELNAQIFCGPDHKIACYDSSPVPKPIELITRQLHDAVLTTIKRTLTREPLSPKAITQAILDLQRGPAQRLERKQEDELPFADFRRIGNSELLLVGFGVDRGASAVPDTRPYLQFFVRNGGVWILQGELGAELRGCYLRVQAIQPRGRSDWWYMVSGVRFGDTGSRLRASLYSFDGSSVKLVWHRQGFVRGAIRFTPSGFDVAYEQCTTGRNWDCKPAISRWRIEADGNVVPIARP